MNPEPPHRPLPAGYVLDQYQFERVLGKPGSFGITYAATDRKSGQRVAIKELFPSDYIVRDASGRVVVKTQSKGILFQQAMEMFRNEATTLTQVRHPNVVRVLDYLEGNGTAYMVMLYEDGYDLSRHLKEQQPHRPNQNEIKKWLFPLLEGLEAVHQLSYLHRDIKPSNIYLTRRHTPLLLDFGAARQMIAGNSRPAEQILTPPFGPIEQYGHSQKQGPYTDIYAMGVVVCKAILYKDPFPPAPERAAKDSFTPLAQRLQGQEYSPKFLQALDWALKVQPAERPATIAAWRTALSADVPPAQPKRNKQKSPPDQSKKLRDLTETFTTFRTSDGSTNWQAVGLATAFVVALICFGLIVWYLSVQR